MKIAILLAAVSMLLRDVAGATSIGPQKAKKPVRRGVVLAGGHLVPPHARRTTAKTHSKGNQHPVSHSLRATTKTHPTTDNSQQPAPHSRRATAKTHHTKVTLDNPLRATRGGTRVVVKQAPDTTGAPTPTPTGAPTPAPTSGMFAGTPSLHTAGSAWFYSPTSAEGWGGCPPPQDILDGVGMTADDFNCEGGGQQAPDTPGAPTPMPTPAPTRTPTSAGTPSLPNTAGSTSFYSPTSAEDWGGCPPPQDFLDAVGMTADDFDCEGGGRVNVQQAPDTPGVPTPAPTPAPTSATFSGVADSNHTSFINYTTLECPAPVPCSLPWADEGGTGIVACASYSAFDGFAGFTMCIDPMEALEGDTCGCCGGKCPEPCTGTSCKVPDWFSEEQTGGESGVWLVDTVGGYAQCVTSEQSSFKQMEGRFTCMDACSTP